MDQPDDDAAKDTGDARRIRAFLWAVVIALFLLLAVVFGPAITTIIQFLSSS